MSEDDKLEKRKKIEKNRAIKRSSPDVRGMETCSSMEQQPKEKLIKFKIEEEEEEEENVCDEGDVMKKYQNDKKKIVNINLLNMASTSKKTYKKKHFKQSNMESVLPFPSPSLPESSSPETVTESRTCNVFNEEKKNCLDTNESRSVEIYQISKSKGERKSPEIVEHKRFLDSNIIKIVLDSEFSKPSEVYTNSTVIRQNDDERHCFYKDKFYVGSDYMITEADILELAKNDENFLMESKKGDKKFLMISKDSLIRRRNTNEKSSSSSSSSYKKTVRDMILHRNCDNNDDTTPLLSSLMNPTASSEEIQNGSLTKNIAEDIFKDIPRQVFKFFYHDLHPLCQCLI